MRSGIAPTWRDAPADSYRLCHIGAGHLGRYLAAIDPQCDCAKYVRGVQPLARHPSSPVGSPSPTVTEGAVLHNGAAPEGSA